MSETLRQIRNRRGLCIQRRLRFGCFAVTRLPIVRNADGEWPFPDVPWAGQGREFVRNAAHIRALPLVSDDGRRVVEPPDVQRGGHVAGNLG